MDAPPLEDDLKWLLRSVPVVATTVQLGSPLEMRTAVSLAAERATSSSSGVRRRSASLLAAAARKRARLE